MPLKVIGAGFGRTGTLSMKLALEKLGFGPCYHMMEVFQNPDHLVYWGKAGRGEPVDWDALFKDYQSSVDWPGCSYYKEHAALYPDAKVILTVRDPEKWHLSTQNTIFSPANSKRAAEAPPNADRDAMMSGIFDATFQGKVADKSHAIKVFNAHTADVRNTIPADRLYVYEVGEGWAGLCEFLGVPAPDEPFPKTNTTEEFASIFGDKVKGQ
jgi:hypothetical protein